MAKMRHRELIEAAEVFGLELRPSEFDPSCWTIVRADGVNVQLGDLDDVSGYLLGFGHGYSAGTTDAVQAEIEDNGRAIDDRDETELFEEESRDVHD